jgi:superfamily II DNA or RNA helicase
MAAARESDLKEIISELSSESSVVSSGFRPRRRTRAHQQKALESWEANDRRGILEHATGSGKTFTALCAIGQMLELGLVPLVLVPSEKLLKQWSEEIREEFGDMFCALLLAGGGHIEWRTKKLLRTWTSPSENEKNRIVLSTLATAVSRQFGSLLREGEHLFLVADEVHRMGSAECRKLLSLNVGPRLGLSATPRRAGDPVGTRLIMEFFGGVLDPVYTLADGIEDNILTPYFYHVHSVHLTEEEQEQWEKETREISRRVAIGASNGQSAGDVLASMQNLLIRRARIAKSAANKISTAREVVQAYYTPKQKWIVYCDDQVQLHNVQEALRRVDIRAYEYHSNMRGDRETTLAAFDATGGIVVSIRCLDEGVDIPSVTHALILASSQNPREFIQRRGRVLRKFDGKAYAEIHDVLVLPGESQLDENTENVSGLRILETEIARAIEFGKHAENPSCVTELERIACRFGVDLRTLVEGGHESDE